MLVDTTSKHLGTATELTCLVPIKPGFLPTVDTRTYATRLRAVFKVLQTLRMASREIRTRQPIPDIVEAARTVHAFSWSIIAEQHLLLSVAFDRPWEPYIRVIWKDLGPLLDLFLCNCDGFTPSTAPFERYADCVRRYQVDTSFFYPQSSLTVDDQRYLVALEKAVRTAPSSTHSRITSVVAPSVEQAASRERCDDRGEARTQWQLVLEAMFGLRGFFPPGADAAVLHSATHALLDSSYVDLRPMPPSPALEWFEAPPTPTASSTRPRDERVKPDDELLQGGIVSPYKRVSHGCLLLARIEEPAAARQWIARFADEVTSEARSIAFTRWLRGLSEEARRNTRIGDADRVVRNVAFTYNGLKHLGVVESELAKLPKEFREGMEARAGLLGDVRHNHPEHWQLPRWNVEIDAGGQVSFVEDLAVDGTASDPRRPPIRMATVDVVILLNARSVCDQDSRWSEAHPLYSEVKRQIQSASASGLRVVSVESLHRMVKNDFTDRERSSDHFGFAEGISQPDPNVGNGASRDRVDLGELIVGFKNQREDRDLPREQQGSWLDMSSFLVVRKLRQDVDAWNTAIAGAAEKTRLPDDEIKGKMMGRYPDGTLLGVSDGSSNDFTFQNDETGQRCPFHAHIRRGNPRSTKGPTAPFMGPRIARRGLAYGPPHTDASVKTDRGIMFMAYNASIAEQFEVVQRWMSGGNTPSADNATTTYGPQPDPILGLPDVDGQRVYRFSDRNGTDYAIDLGPVPFVQLQWGLYLMTPSIPALHTLATAPTPDLATAAQVVAEGARIVARLRTSDDWAAALEDQSFQLSGRTSAVFAHIRATGGAVRTPYGIVVATSELGTKVLSDDRVFSVEEYQRRFGHTVGEGYLGMDMGPEYLSQSAGPNAALSAVEREEACRAAYETTRAVLKQATVQSLQQAGTIRGEFASTREIPAQRSVPIPLEPVVSAVLGTLAQQWFDIPDGESILVDRPDTREAVNRKTGALQLTCPFSFLAPSRYVFSSPQPRPALQAVATERGSALLAAVRRFVKNNRNRKEPFSGKVTQVLFESIPDDDDLLARVLLGLVFGFVPTVHGSILQVLAQWLGDESLWRMQQAARTAMGQSPAERALALEQHIRRAMLRRPVPPLLHRTATEATKIGPVAVAPGDRVVVAIASMTQETLAGGGDDVTQIFGGDRESKTGHPTHACPGQHIALGVIDGVLLAILDHAPLTPTGALVTVRVPIDVAMGMAGLEARTGS